MLLILESELEKLRDFSNGWNPTDSIGFAELPSFSSETKDGIITLNYPLSVWVMQAAILD